MTAATEPGVLERLYDLLPSVYRERDAPLGFPLRALLQAIAEQVAAVESDIDQLYDDWFVETCQDWLLPYLGRLVGYEPLPLGAEATQAPLEARMKLAAVIAPRAEVGNTIALRERKGTMRALEDLAFLVTGWPAAAVELSDQVAITQSINAPQPGRGRIARIIGAGARDELDRVGQYAASPAPFDTLGHLPDVRRLSAAHSPGGFGVGAVALHVWRLLSHRIDRAPAAKIDSRLFTFDATGHARPLFNPQTGMSDERACESNLPVPLRRAALAADLDAYYGEDRALMLLTGDDTGSATAIPADQIEVGDLSSHSGGVGRDDRIMIDPETGLIAVPAAWCCPLWATYHQACAGNLGGGGYSRPLSPADDLSWITYDLETSPGEWRPDPSDSVSIGALDPADRMRIMHASWEDGIATLAVERTAQLAIGALVTVSVRRTSGFNGTVEVTSVYPVSVSGSMINSALHSRATQRVIEITSSDEVAHPRIELTEGQTLVIRAADGQRPKFDRLVVTGRGARLVLEGLLLAESVRMEAALEELVIRHCTLVPLPHEAALDVRASVAHVGIEHAIIGGVRLSRARTVAVGDSIVTAGTGISAPNATATVRRSTLLGGLRVGQLALGQDSIFAGELRVDSEGEGSEARCCALPASTPRLAGEHCCTRERPRFASRRYAAPAYCQLAHECPRSIRTGAEDGGEMGAFHDRYEPQREALLRRRLEEFIPATMTAEVVDAT